MNLLTQSSNFTQQRMNNVLLSKSSKACSRSQRSREAPNIHYRRLAGCTTCVSTYHQVSMPQLQSRYKQNDRVDKRSTKTSLRRLQ